MIKEIRSASFSTKNRTQTQILYDRIQTIARLKAEACEVRVVVETEGGRVVV